MRMRKLSLLLTAMVLSLTLGCGGSSKQTDAAAAPLTVAAWKDLPASEKYLSETLERLKAGNLELNTPEGWERFQKTDLAAARRKDTAGKSKR